MVLWSQFSANHVTFLENFGEIFVDTMDFPGFSRWVLLPTSFSQEIGPIGILGPGASLGEAALLGLLHVRTASVQALQDATMERSTHFQWVPSGKDWHSYWTWPFIPSFPTKQRVSHVGSHLNHRDHGFNLVIQVVYWVTWEVSRVMGIPQIIHNLNRIDLHWKPWFKEFKWEKIVSRNSPVKSCELMI